eukprot:TRINITY_DN1330_c0_g1_i9.p1 TRINITY_DN1330_c0_g1~~TRINITY_DN1330_c0_g1_i9.p1  ORF type:complete len:313 (+),score=111.66 TRINITY_DN1330_c0_g1_i9:298-1236(+)
MAFGSSFVTTWVILFAQNTPSAIGKYVIFVFFMLLMTMVIIVVWKLSNFVTDEKRGIPMVFTTMALDDLLGDSLFISNNSELSIITVLTVLTLLVRLILRDVGWFEKFWNRIRTKAFGDKNMQLADQLEGKEREEFLLAIKMNFARKYVLYAAQDLASEHLSVLAIPFMIAMDYYIPGWKLISSDFESETAIVNMIISFVILFVVKLFANKIVLYVQQRRLEDLQLELEEFIAKYGELERDSPLCMFADYEEDWEGYQNKVGSKDKKLMEMSLVERHDKVGYLHFRRNFWLFVTGALNACLIAISSRGNVIM